MKKALSLLLVLTLILGVFPISVYAEETTAATITMTTDATESLKIGDTFSVTAALSNNPGYASITLTLLWNSNVVKFTGFATEFDEDEEVDVLKDTIIGGNIVINNDVGIITSGRTNNSSKNGTLFIANFEVIGYGQCNISLDRSDITKFTLANLNKDQISVNYVDTAVAPLVVSEPVDEDAFTVYYQIEDTIVDDDSDTVHEVDLDTNFNVGVYVKAGAEQVMQAFDIYPEWNENLEFVSVAGEDNVTTIVDKMADTDPHFQTQFEDSLASTDVTITTTGTKIATLTMKLKASAIYDTHYPIWIEAATNLAKEKDPESVKKVTVTAEGDFNVETLKTYTVTYDANNGTWGDGVADPTQTKKHGVDLDIVPPTTNPTRTNYSFQGWSTDSGDGNTVNAPTTYTANEDKTLYAVWKQNVFTVRFFNADGDEITDAKKENVQPDAKVSFSGTNPTKTSTAQHEYTFKGWGDGADATTTVDLTNYPITKDTDFYPLYEAVTRKYTVTWYDEDGTIMLNTTTVEYGETPAYIGTPTKTDTAEYDYSFAGWSATKGGDVLATLPTVDGDAEYYAVFTAEKRSYEVTYVDGEHGTLEGKTTESVAYGSNPTIAPTVKPADGYTFIGWCNGTTTSDKLTEFVIEDTTTLTAQYEAVSYKITLDPAGGAVADGKTNIDYTIESTDMLPAATKTGYAFNGWKLETTVDGWEAKTYAANTAVTGKWGNVTLVAQWVEDAHDVKQSGDVKNGEATPDENSAKEGDTVTVTVTPAEGYKFDEEKNEVTYTYTDADDNKETVTIPVTDDDGDGVYTGTFEMPDYAVEINATFTAINYTVEVTDPANGTVTATPITAIIGTEITLTNAPDDGYQWVSYKVTNDTTQEEITVNDGKFTMPASNVTVTATFTGKTYNINYVSNGGTGTTNSTSATFGTAATLAENAFTKTGYNFKGWSTTADGEAVTSFNPTIYAERYTLYAVWEAKKVNVTLDHNYVGSTNGSIIVTYDGTYENLTTPTRTGYDFTGWYESTAEDAEEVTKDTTVAKDSAHTLYAKWTAKTYKVTLDENKGTINSGNVTEYTYGVGATLPTDVTRPGYTFDGWKDAEGSKATTIPETATDDKTFTAQWILDTYTVTLIPAGGTVSDSAWTLNNDGNYTKTYTIESGITLPEATKDMYTFGGWDLNAEAGSWKDGSPYEAKEYKDSRWGNVTLTAVWNQAVSFKVVEYKYAYTDNYLLTVADNLNTSVDSLTQTYKFNGQTMYWTDAATYKVNTNDIGTFFLLVDKTYVDVKDNGDGTKIVALKAAAYDYLKSETADVTKITHNGDINTDGKVNIADANAVYQMVLSGGGYYSKDQLTDDERLMADMSKDVAEAHASIADVNAIVTIINNAANAN